MSNIQEVKLAPYACDEKYSLGRKHAEKNVEFLSAYQSDRDRIIHSTAFRRLEYKTQVFVNHVGDHYRTRLTHTIEVSQIARILARELALNEDLVECIALAHDLGHPPFGHAGEEALQEVAEKFGGFDHNAQGLKFLTYLEQRYAEFDGLNLTWETLEGVAKHNGPLEGKNSKNKTLHRVYNEIKKIYDLKLDTYPSLEAQVASLADDIAYINHDIDDGLRAGFFTIDDLKTLKLVGETFTKVIATYPTSSTARIINEAIRKLKKEMVTDLVTETRKRISMLNIKDVSSVRNQGQWVVSFSKEMDEVKVKLKEFLLVRLYRHYRVNRNIQKARKVVSELFMKLMDSPDCLPTEWYEKTLQLNEQGRAEIIIDYIAGMTDRYAIEEHKKLFDPLIY